METYKGHRPTQFDSHITLEDERETWLIIPCARNRDSDCLTESNFHSALAMLGGEGDDVEVHRFGHWGPGWYEIIIVRPGSKAEVKGREIEDRLEGYPVLNENDFCEREQEAAQEAWKHCYSVRDRIAYIRKNRSDFEFECFSDMLGCVRGNFFAGCRD